MKGGEDQSKFWYELNNPTGSQQSNDLKGALESEMEKTKQMEESMAKLDEEMKRSDQLLAQMMPKSVSEKVGVYLQGVQINMRIQWRFRYRLFKYSLI